MTIRRVTLLEALDMGREAWDGLVEAAAPSPFMTWAWHRAWADTADAHAVAGAFALVSVADSGRLEAIAPLALRRERFHRVPMRILGWASGDTGAPDHLDVAAATGATGLAELADALLDMPWTVLILGNLAQDAPNAERLCEALTERGCRVSWQRLWPCNYVTLPSSWDEYLAGLKAAFRQKVRQYERQLRRAGQVVLRFHDGEDFDAGWAGLVRLHKARWNGGGIFATASFTEMLRRFSRYMLETGHLRMLSLEVDGATVAAEILFRYRDTMFGYQSGRDPAWDRANVGTVIRAAAIRNAIEEGCAYFDFLRGAETYKNRWAPDARWCRQAVVLRPGWSQRPLAWLHRTAHARIARRSERRHAGLDAADSQSSAQAYGRPVIHDLLLSG